MATLRLFTLAFLMLALPAFSAEAGGKAAYIITSDDKTHEGILGGYENGFLILIQDKRELAISPADVKAIFMDKRDLVGLVKDSKAFFAEMVAVMEKNYFKTKPAENDPDNERFFKYCMDEAAAIAFGFSAEGMEKLKQKLEEYLPKVRAVQNDPNLIMKPESYRVLLLSLAMLQARSHLIGKELRESPGGSHTLRDQLRDQFRAIIALHAALKNVTGSDDLSVGNKQIAEQRLKFLADEWNVEAIKRTLNARNNTPGMIERRQPRRNANAD